MIVETLLLAMAIGKIRGGKLAGIGEIVLNKWAYLALGFIISNLSIYLITKGYTHLQGYFTYIQLASYVLILTTLYYNRTIRGYCSVAAGMLMNLIPMLMNGGKMPVSSRAMEMVGLHEEMALISQGRIVTHTILDMDSPLWFLSDTLYDFLPSVAEKMN